MKYFKWCCRPGSNLQVRDTLHCLHLFAIILVSLLVQSWHDGHVIHHMLLMVWQQVCLVSFTEHSPQFYKPSDIHWYLNSLTCPPVLFIATSHAVTGEHRGWSPSYLASKVVPRGYSGSLELIKRPGTCYYQITCLNLCSQTLVKSAQRVWRIRNSDYLASTVVVEWFERLLPVPGSVVL